MTMIELIGGNLMSAFCAGLALSSFVHSALTGKTNQMMFYAILTGLTVVGAWS